MKTVRDIEYIRECVKHEFPDAIRGSVARTRWDNRRKVLHLSYFIAPDTVGGLKVLARGNLLYLYEWDTNYGDKYIFVESDLELFIKRIKERTGKIDRTVYWPVV